MKKGKKEIKKRRKVKTKKCPKLDTTILILGIVILIIVSGMILLGRKTSTTYHSPAVSSTSEFLGLRSCTVDSSTRHYSCDITKNDICVGDMIVSITDSSDHIAVAFKGTINMGSIILTNNKLTGDASLVERNEPLNKGSCMFTVVCDENPETETDDRITISKDCVIV